MTEPTQERRKLVFYEEALKYVDHDGHECSLRSPWRMIEDDEVIFREVLPGDPTPEQIEALRRERDELRERISNLDYRQLECGSCRAKSGTPELCASCLRIRQYVCDTLEGE